MSHSPTSTAGAVYRSIAATRGNEARAKGWERAALTSIERNDFVALSLHDCYASHWLPHYRELLRKFMSRGRLRTVDDVAFDVILRHAQ